MYVWVALDTGATSSIDTLIYELPDGLADQVEVGTCVLVPLANRQAVGYITSFSETTEYENTHPIIARIDGPVHLTDELIALAKWISDRYICPLSRSVFSLIPQIMHLKVQPFVEFCDPPQDSQLTDSEESFLQAIRQIGDFFSVEAIGSGEDRTKIMRFVRQLESKGFVRRVYRLVDPKAKPLFAQGYRPAANTPEGIKLTEKQQYAYDTLHNFPDGELTVKLVNVYEVSQSSLASLAKKGLAEKIDIPVRRKPHFVKRSPDEHTLTADQQLAFDTIKASVDKNTAEKFLVHGVTASGKTEVYLRLIEHAMRLGKNSLVVLPEIALTTQILDIFKGRFADDVAVMHSGLSYGERYDEWVRVREGEARVVLGARSAVFAPIKNIGLVIVDEEHEISSYKQENPPRYVGRDVAEHRAQLCGAVYVCGSATPAIETYHRAKTGDIRLVEMPTRVAGRQMPKVTVADLREEYVKGQPTIFSEALEEGIRARLTAGQQVMLLQNRRAYSTVLLCRDCGYVMKCPDCSVSLKYHAHVRKLTCHHCDYTIGAPDTCPNCQSMRLGKFGIGTEKVEEETKRIFTDARVIRMDRDTTATKGAHSRILETFRNGEADILVGTQMIAKGLDIPNVTLVGIISADTSIHLPDFRAGERTFQLISQVAGRSGRGVEPGEVIVQTFDPDHPSITAAVQNDYQGFYEQEIADREFLRWPPYSRIVHIVSHSEDPDEAEETSRIFANELKRRQDSSSPMRILGPNPSVISKIKKRHRYSLIVKLSDIKSGVRAITDVYESRPEFRTRMAIDVDPSNML